MKKVFLTILITLSLNSFSQDLEDLLDAETDETTIITSATFKGTRILNGHSIETRKKGDLEFLISHRFGRINSGADELFGLDDSNIRFGFEYALTDDLTIAIGRSSFEKTYDTYLKYKVLKQKEGKKTFPFSLTYFGSITAKTIKDYDPANKPTFVNRLTYTNQLLIAKKFNANFSLQLMPTHIHFNTIKSNKDDNDIYALGFGSRIKLNKRLAINTEYYYTLNPFDSIENENSLALGLEIETGGHVFQIILSNSRSMIEKGFIAEGTGNFFNGDIHLGFNISRIF